MRKNKKGFTLIELLIVMAVIAILISIVIPSFKGMQDQANVSKVKSELAVLQSALESYYIHNKAYPAAVNTDDFPDLSTQAPAIISTAAPKDPFSTANPQDEYKYILNVRNYAIYSVGPDGSGAVTAVTPDTVIETNGTSCVFITNAAVKDKEP